MKRSVIALTLCSLLFAIGAMSASAQDMMAKSDNMTSDDKRPVVVFIRADWCPYCKELEPKMSKLVEQYGGKLKFVTLDITNTETTKKSAMIAKDAGLSEFFEANKTKASTVAILKDKKQVFATLHNTEQKDIVAAFYAAIKE